MPKKKKFLGSIQLDMVDYDKIDFAKDYYANDLNYVRSPNDLLSDKLEYLKYDWSFIDEFIVYKYILKDLGSGKYDTVITFLIRIGNRVFPFWYMHRYQSVGNDFDNFNELYVHDLLRRGLSTFTSSLNYVADWNFGKTTKFIYLSSYTEKIAYTATGPWVDKWMCANWSGGNIDCALFDYMQENNYYFDSSKGIIMGPRQEIDALSGGWTWNMGKYVQDESVFDPYDTQLYMYAYSYGVEYSSTTNWLDNTIKYNTYKNLKEYNGIDTSELEIKVYDRKVIEMSIMAQNSEKYWPFDPEIATTYFGNTGFFTPATMQFWGLSIPMFMATGCLIGNLDDTLIMKGTFREEYTIEHIPVILIQPKQAFDRNDVEDYPYLIERVKTHAQVKEYLKDMIQYYISDWDPRTKPWLFVTYDGKRFTLDNFEKHNNSDIPMRRDSLIGIVNDNPSSSYQHSYMMREKGLGHIDIQKLLIGMIKESLRLSVLGRTYKSALNIYRKGYADALGNTLDKYFKLR